MFLQNQQSDTDECIYTIKQWHLHQQSDIDECMYTIKRCH